MKELIDEMGILQFLAMCFVFCCLVFGVIECCGGSTKTSMVEVMDKEIVITYDKEHHRHVDYYVFVNAADGIHHVSVSRTQYCSTGIGQMRKYSARYGKYTHITYLESIY